MCVCLDSLLERFHSQNIQFYDTLNSRESKNEIDSVNAVVYPDAMIDSTTMGGASLGDDSDIPVLEPVTEK